MLIAAAAGLLATVVVIRFAVRRRHRLAAAHRIAAVPTRSAVANRRALLALASAAAAIIGLGGLLGIVVGAVSAVGLVVTGRAQPAPTAVAEDVAIVLDLIAGCLSSGLSMPDAVEAAADAGDPVTREACLTTARQLRRGADPYDAWAGWVADPSLAPAARVTMRTTATGAAVADDLSRTAARIRSQRRAARQERVQRAGVWVVVPLGLCFLPAFVLVAVVPLVLGLFAAMR